MSRQDLREEFRETEGSPQIRSRIRGLQRQMRRRRVKADVSRAAVVLTNRIRALRSGRLVTYTELEARSPRKALPELSHGDN
jgi:FlhB HrpN YscU SpaS Family